MNNQFTKAIIQLLIILGITIYFSQYITKDPNNNLVMGIRDSLNVLGANTISGKSQNSLNNNISINENVLTKYQLKKINDEYFELISGDIENKISFDDVTKLITKEIFKSSGILVSINIQNYKDNNLQTYVEKYITSLKNNKNIKSISQLNKINVDNIMGYEFSIETDIKSSYVFIPLDGNRFIKIQAGYSVQNGSFYGELYRELLTNIKIKVNK